MSIGLTSVAIYYCTLIAAWLVGMLAPQFSRGRLAIVSAGLLLIPGLALFVDAPIHLVGIDGEEVWGFLFVAAPAFLLGLIGITLSLINRSRLHTY